MRRGEIAMLGRLHRSGAWFQPKTMAEVNDCIHLHQGGFLKRRGNGDGGWSYRIDRGSRVVLDAQALGIIL